MSNKSLDIPNYGDSFVIESIWQIKGEGNNCHLTIKWQVRYLKSVWLKALIEKSAKSANEEAFAIWVREARGWLSSNENAILSPPPLIRKRTKSKVKVEGISKGGVVGVGVDNFHPKVTSPASSGGLDSKKTNTSVSIPFIESEVSLEIFCFILIVFVMCFGFTQLLFHVRSLENQISIWESNYELYHERIQFLQEFTIQLSRFVHGDDEYLKGEWQYWQETNGLDWRLAEWRTQMETLKQILSNTLHEISYVLAEDTYGTTSVLSEDKLRQLLLTTDRSTVCFFNFPPLFSIKINSCIFLSLLGVTGKTIIN